MRILYIVTNWFIQISTFPTKDFFKKEIIHISYAFSVSCSHLFILAALQVRYYTHFTDEKTEPKKQLTDMLRN